MAKKIIIIAVAIVALAAGAFSYLKTDRAVAPDAPLSGAESLATRSEAAPSNLSATGTVAAISSDKLTISLADGSSKAYSLDPGSVLLKLKAATSTVPGASVVVVYSKAMGKPVTALLSEPFASTDQSIEIISGKLVSIKKNVLDLAVGGETKSYEFEGANPLFVVSPVPVKEVKPGDSITVEYKEVGEGATVIRATLFE